MPSQAFCAQSPLVPGDEQELRPFLCISFLDSLSRLYVAGCGSIHLETGSRGRQIFNTFSYLLLPACYCLSSQTKQGHFVLLGNFGTFFM